MEQVEIVDKKLSTQDLKLLYEIYKYRALSTAQIMKVGGLGKWYVYKKITQLRNEGYIYTHQISGNYIPNQNRQGSYHRVSNKTIILLKGNGYVVDRTADDLRVRKYRLPYLLVGNDLCVSLEKKGWEFTDSRAIKKLLNLNRGDVLHGSLTNPTGEKEYSLYVFLRKVRLETLELIKREIVRNPLENVIVITRGLKSFNSIIKSFTDNRNRLIKGGGIKVLPLQFGQSYFNISNDMPINHEIFLNELGLDLISDSSNKINFETNIDFDYLVAYKGEEYYFMDLLDNDLMKIRLIEEYRKEHYIRDGRKVLALTTNADFHMGFHKEMLSHIKHIKYLVIDPIKVVDFASNISNEIDSE